MENLKRLKKETVEWVKTRKQKHNKDLNQIDIELRNLESPESDGYETHEKKDIILLLESHRSKILLAREEEWRLKSRAIWLKDGDENTNFFLNYAKGRKNSNTIWKLKDEEGREANTFESLSLMGRSHFQKLFTDKGEVTLAEAIRTT